MRLPHALLLCVCLLGVTQLTWSQTKATAIPGYLNPSTGTFTTRVSSSATPQPDAEAALAGTGIFFREQFNITITNYDQPTSDLVACEVSMSSTGDSNSSYFHELEVVPATASGGNWTCSVPVLTLWTLQTPGSDSIYATVSVYIYAPGQTAVDGLLPSLRESDQSMILTQPGNTQTVMNNVSFQL